MVKCITGGSLKITYHPNGPEGEAKEIDFTPPFRRIHMIEDLQKILQVDFPPMDQLDTPGQ